MVCSICHKNFPTKSERVLHFKLVHKNRQTIVTAVGLSIIVERKNNKFQCPFQNCETTTDRGDHLLSHYKRIHFPKESVSAHAESESIPLVLRAVDGISPDDIKRLSIYCISVKDLKLLLCTICNTCINPTIKCLLAHISDHSKRGVKRMRRDIEEDKKISLYFEETGFSNTNQIHASLFSGNDAYKLQHPIPGIAIHKGYGCQDCAYCGKEWKTVKKHIRQNHGNVGTPSIGVSMQQLFKAGGLRNYCRISETFELTAGDMNDLLLNSSWNQNYDQTPEQFQQINPFLRVSNWMKHAESIIPVETKFVTLDAVMSTSANSLPTYVRRLPAVIMDYLQNTSNLLLYTAYSVRVAIECASDKTTAFKDLQKSTTKKNYAQHISKFVSLLCRSADYAYEHRQLCEKLVGPVLSEDSVNAIQQLVNNLKNESTEPKEMLLSIQCIFMHVLFLRSQELNAIRATMAPVMRFQILSSLRAGNDDDPLSTMYRFAHVSNITTPLAILIRLFRSVILTQIWQESADQERIKVLLRLINPEEVFETFANLKTLLALAQKMESESPKPPKISPLTLDGTEFLIENYKMSLNMLKWSVANIIGEVTQSVNELCLGACTTWLDSLDTSNIYDEAQNEKTAYGFLHEKRNPFIHHSRDLTNRILSDFALRSHFTIQIHCGSTNTIWNENSVNQWMLEADKLTMSLTVLLHLTGACGPPRSTEYESFLLTNTCANSRNVYFLGNKLCFFQRYFKSSNLIGHTPPVPRFVPSTLCNLFLKYLSLIRPQQWLFSKHFCTPEISNNFQQFWMTTRNGIVQGKTFSVNLAATLNRTGCPPLKVSTYRHVAAYLADYLPKAVGDDVFDALHTSAGHGLQTARINYGLTDNIVNDISQGVFHKAYKAALLWHDLLLNLNARADTVSKSNSPVEPVFPSVSTSSLTSEDVIVSPIISTLEQQSFGCNMCSNSTCKKKSNISSNQYTNEHISLQHSYAAFHGLSLLGHSQWRSREQALALAYVCEGTRHLLTILPTGHGKSLLYLVPSILYPQETCVVIVPLSILLVDHVATAGKHNISSTVWRNQHIPYISCPQIVFVSVEDSVSTEFENFAHMLVAHKKLHRIVFDEVHLAFADYRKHMNFLLRLRTISAQCIMITASLPPSWEEMLFRKMGMCNVKVVRLPTLRENIEYKVLSTKPHQLLIRLLADELQKWCRRWKEDKEARVLVFFLTSAETESIHCKLKSQFAIPIVVMHSKISLEEKKLRLHMFESQQTIMFATSLISCGYNYQSINMVIHYGTAHSFLDFHQQSGRAGRSGNHSLSIVLRDPEPAPYLSDDIECKQFYESFVVNVKNECRRAIIHSYVDEISVNCFTSIGSQLCDVCKVVKTNFANHPSLKTASFHHPQSSYLLSEQAKLKRNVQQMVVFFHAT